MKEARDTKLHSLLSSLKSDEATSDLTEQE